MSRDPDKTPEQEMRLALYLEYPTISACDADLIIALKSKRRGPMEERELSLLLDPSTRAYAHKIVLLEIHPARGAMENRELELLLHPYARPYARKIVSLEFRSKDGEAELETLYLKVCCKIPEEAPNVAALRGLLRGPGRMVHPSRACSVESGYSAQFFSPINHDDALNRMRDHIDLLVDRQLVSHYLSISSVSMVARSTETMCAYTASKVKLLRFGLLKYFVSNQAPNFNDENLRAVVAAIRDRITSRELTLNHEEKILNLREFLHTSQPLSQNLAISY